MTTTPAPLPENLGAARSPAEIGEEILQTSPYRQLRRLKCDYEDGVLTVAGRLPSFYLMQLAQTMLINVVGVERVENRIELANGG